jgi:hypothetical protein
VASDRAGRASARLRRRADRSPQLELGPLARLGRWTAPNSRDIEVAIRRGADDPVQRERRRQARRHWTELLRQSIEKERLVSELGGAQEMAECVALALLIAGRDARILEHAAALDRLEMKQP